MKCVICSRRITTDPDGWDGGHNAEPVAKGKWEGVIEAIPGLAKKLAKFKDQFKSDESETSSDSPDDEAPTDE